MFEYQDSLVTYCDILGFEAMTVGVSGAQTIGTVLRSFQTCSAPSTTAGDVVVSSFSDLVVRSSALRTGSAEEVATHLIREGYDLAFAQAEIAKHCVFVRGSITLGPLCSTTGLLFGPALVRAYKLERNSARFPRIILDDTLANQLRSDAAQSPRVADELSALYRTDDDGRVFVDYLRARIRLIHSNIECVSLLAHHRDAIKVAKDSLAKTKSASLEDKVNWLTTYHNGVVQQMPDWVFDGIQIYRSLLMVPTE